MINHSERVSDPIQWIEDVISDIKKYRDEKNPDWIRRMSIRLAEYAIILSEYADDWEFDERIHQKLEKKEEG